MHVSTFDLFKIGIGPSSSHTVGPMAGAARFVHELVDQKRLDSVSRIRIVLFGSLGATGKGHGTDTAIMLGLMGNLPDQVDPVIGREKVEVVMSTGQLTLAGGHSIDFDYSLDLLFKPEIEKQHHANAMTLSALDAGGDVIVEETFYSIGGGFIVTDAELADRDSTTYDGAAPFPLASADRLLEYCRWKNCAISDIMLANELSDRDEAEIQKNLIKIDQAMDDCIEQGLKSEGTLPGRMALKRRAPAIYHALMNAGDEMADPLATMDWINLYALAVSEENAAGNRMVTAPTNGAAGIIPAVLRYFKLFCKCDGDQQIGQFLLTAGAIGALFKLNASISGAEVGCQGEVGAASAMAAAGLTEVLGGTPEQVENAAEIALEHHLGLTCDPIDGLVQVPCIERNAIAAVHSVNAARLALRGDGTHHVSLDKAIKTMLETGRDMQAKYKETARGGLAVNVPEC